MINNLHFIHFPKLESKRLVFRQFTLLDSNDIYEMRTSDQIMNYMDSDYHESVSKSKEFINQNIDRYTNKQGIFWAIINKESNEFIGDFAFWNIDKKNARGEIGYSLKANFWGKGFMSETMSTIVEFGFNELNLHSIEANINPSNNASRKLLLNSGFKKEAYFRENYFHDGKYLDSEIYSLLAKDLDSNKK